MRSPSLSVRPLGVLVVLALAAALLVPVAAEAAGDLEAQFVAAVNQERTARGLPEVRPVPEMASVARAWSQVMAADGHLRHNPNFSSQLQPHGSAGENVGYARASSGSTAPSWTARPTATTS